MFKSIAMGLLCLPSVALAQIGFTIDQATGQTGGELSFTYLTFDDSEDVSARQINVFAEFAATPRAGSGHFGGYVALSSATISADDPLGGSESATGILGVELGGTYTTPTSATSALTARLGFTVPREGDLEELAIAALASPARLTDLSRIFPETGVARFSVSAHGRSGRLVYRFDGGLDIGIAGELGTELDPLVRLNGAVGVAAGPTVIGAELVNLINPSEGGDEGMLHTAALGIRADFNGLQPGLALIAPLDDEASDTFGPIVCLSLRGVLAK